MKGLKQVLAASLFILSATASIAATQTPMDANWMCTTNASSSSVEADKAADDKMANSAMSAADAFSFAVANCRDCTKITCKVK